MNLHISHYTFSTNTIYGASKIHMAGNYNQIFSDVMLRQKNINKTLYKYRSTNGS